MFCTQCGSKNGEFDRFCTSCGAALKRPSLARHDEKPVETLAEVQPQADALETATVTETVGNGTAAADSIESTEADSGESDSNEAEPETADEGNAVEADNATEADGTVESAESVEPAEPTEAIRPVSLAAFAEPDIPAVPAVPVASAGTAVAATPSSKRRTILIAAIVAVCVVLAGTVAAVTYHMELWGGKTLPVASKSTATSDKAPTASNVLKQLKNKGLDASARKEFSGEKKGTFLGYANAQDGERIRSGQHVVVRESAGPGVPSDTVGKQATTVTSTFKNMGVPVHYKQVVVSDSSKVKPGSVVSTYPQPGQGVSDEKTGIYIGVAAKGDGLPADIVGQDVNTVKTELEGKGYTVKTEKRLSSKQYVGKISGSLPGPGSKLSDGQTVTLYEGVDAKGAKQTFMKKYPEMDKAELTGNSNVAAGQWCTNAGDCITLSETEQYGSDDSLRITSGGVDTEYSQTGDVLTSCDAIQQSFCSSQKADYLLEGNTGAFELMPFDAFDSYWCGTDIVFAPGFCSADKAYSLDDSKGHEESGGTVRMPDMFMVAPVGTDLDALESNGYFDAAALADAKKQKVVNTDRPFLIYRDVNLYKKSETVRDASWKNYFNPFLPYQGVNGSKDAVVKMKPAPSDDTVYYLVENTQPDWSTLDDAKVKGAASTSSH